MKSVTRAILSAEPLVGLTVGVTRGNVGPVAPLGRTHPASGVWLPLLAGAPV